MSGVGAGDAYIHRGFGYIRRPVRRLRTHFAVACLTDLCLLHLSRMIGMLNTWSIHDVPKLFASRFSMSTFIIHMYIKMRSVPEKFILSVAQVEKLSGEIHGCEYLTEFRLILRFGTKTLTTK